jgi:hypothetical protein
MFPRFSILYPNTKPNSFDIKDDELFTLTYELNKKTESKLGYIFVFRTKKSALSMASDYQCSYQRYKIFKCECDKLIPFPIRYIPDTYKNSSVWKVFWENIKIGNYRHLSYSRRLSLPKDTYGCNWVIPIKEVK